MGSAFVTMHIVLISVLIYFWELQTQVCVVVLLLTYLKTKVKCSKFCKGSAVVRVMNLHRRSQVHLWSVWYCESPFNEEADISETRTPIVYTGHLNKSLLVTGNDKL